MAASLPMVREQLAVGQRVDVSLLDTSGPHSIFIQVCRLEKGLSDLSDRMAQHYGTSPEVPYKPMVGEVVVGRFSLDKSWCRAEVLAVDLKKALAYLLYVDYGDKEELPFQEMRAIKPEFAALPIQRVVCAVSGVSISNNGLGTEEQFAIYKACLDKFLTDEEGRLRMTVCVESVVDEVVWVSVINDRLQQTLSQMLNHELEVALMPKPVCPQPAAHTQAPSHHAHSLPPSVKYAQPVLHTQSVTNTQPVIHAQSVTHAPLKAYNQPATTDIVMAPAQDTAMWMPASPYPSMPEFELRFPEDSKIASATENLSSSAPFEPQQAQLSPHMWPSSGMPELEDCSLTNVCSAGERLSEININRTNKSSSAVNIGTSVERPSEMKDHMEWTRSFKTEIDTPAEEKGSASNQRPSNTNVNATSEMPPEVNRNTKKRNRKRTSKRKGGAAGERLSEVKANASSCSPPTMDRSSEMKANVTRNGLSILTANSAVERPNPSVTPVTRLANEIATMSVDSMTCLTEEVATMSVKTEPNATVSLQKAQLSHEGKVACIVQEIVSSQEFYLMRAEAEDDLVWLHTRLARYCGGLKPGRQLTCQTVMCGSLVLAQFSTDSEWYRGCVTGVSNDGTSCTVFFVDFGNREEKLVSSVLPLPVEFSTLPSQAICCRLAGVPYSLSEDVEARFKKVCLQAEVSVKVTGRQNDKYFVEIFTADSLSITAILGINISRKRGTDKLHSLSKSSWRSRHLSSESIDSVGLDCSSSVDLSSPKKKSVALSSLVHSSPSVTWDLAKVKVEVE